LSQQPLRILILRSTGYNLLSFGNAVALITRKEKFPRLAYIRRMRVESAKQKQPRAKPRQLFHLTKTTLSCHWTY
jgi:hypothetical protein